MNKFFGEASSPLALEAYDLVDEYVEGGTARCLELGPYTTRALLSDPKRFGFMLARHKFVGKMLTGYDKVLEVGCQEGFTSLFTASFVKNLVSVDFFREHIKVAVEKIAPYAANVEFRGHDILDGPVEGSFDAAFSMDVFEHIDPAQEDLYFENIKGSLTDQGVFICGIPSLESQEYASEGSKLGHINCKSGQGLKDICERHFRNVFMFSMNDEVLHTGFFPMSQYLIALCVTPKR